jgi:hypothetical protein
MQVVNLLGRLQAEGGPVENECQWPRTAKCINNHRYQDIAPPTARSLTLSLIWAFWKTTVKKDHRQVNLDLAPYDRQGPQDTTLDTHATHASTSVSELVSLICVAIADECQV